MKEVLWREAVCTLLIDLRVYTYDTNAYIGYDKFVLGSTDGRSTAVKANAAQALVTVIDSVTAKGIHLPPGIIFKGQKLQMQWFTEQFRAIVPPEWGFDVSDNGWTSNTIAIKWLRDIFVPAINKIRNDDESRAVLLVLDGHDSHRSVEFMTMCYRHNIHPCWLPAHTSHGLQPLDNGIFSVFKGAFDKAMEDINSQTDSSPLGKINFIRCLVKARKAVTKRTIKNTFRHTGIYPISREKALQHPEIQPDRSPEPEIPEAESSDEDSDSDDTRSESSIEEVDENYVTRDYVLSLGQREDRTARYKAKRIADEIDSLRAQVALLERENAGLKAEKEVREKTKRRKGIPNPNQEFITMFEIGDKNLTTEALDALPRPQKRQKVAVVEVEEEEEDDDEVASEPEVLEQVVARSGRAIRRPARFAD